MRLLPILSSLVVSLILLLVLPGALILSSQPANEPREEELPQPAVRVVFNQAETATTLPESPDPSAGWVIVAEGIEYREFHLDTPNNVYVARMDRSNLNVTIESSIAQGKLASGLETVSGMSSRYKQTINYWGGNWGARNDVMVAINGYYYDPTTGIPQRGVVHSGWYAKRFDNLEIGSGFAWKLDRSTFIGECVTHPSDKQFVAYKKSGTLVAYQYFDGINVTRQANQFILYTPQYDSKTRTDGKNAVEVLVRLERPAMIALSSNMTKGIIVDIRNNQGSTSIPFDHVVLSMHGDEKSKFISYGISVGDEVGIAHKIKNCDTSLPFEWDSTYASIGGDFYFLKNGLIQTFSTNAGAIARHPRTAIAYNDKYIYFIVVDGRDPYASLGMTVNELALFVRDTLGAINGIAQDGGGSSTMVLNGEIKNNTFCNIYFCKGKVFLPLIIQSTPPGQADWDRIVGQELPQTPVFLPAPTTDEASSGVGPATMDVATGKIQRLVANGMLMVVVEPISQTATFQPGEAVMTYTSTNIRLGPGTNYAVLATVSANTKGVVLDDQHSLNGVLATGYSWWKVDFDGLVGWVAESLLRRPLAPSRPPSSDFR